MGASSQGTLGASSEPFQSAHRCRRARGRCWDRRVTAIGITVRDRMIPSLVGRRARTIRPGIVVLLAACAAWPGLAAERGGEQITPLLLAVHDAPMPFKG